MAPDFARFEQSYGMRIKIVEVNVDDSAAMKAYGRYKETDYVPETVVIKNGKVVFDYAGLMTEADLEKAADTPDKR